MLVLHDGAVMVPFVDFPSTPEQTANWTESRLWTVVSTDGGVTFSAPKPGPVKMTGEETREAREGTPRFRGGSWTMLAVDRSEPFRDRAYAVWPDYSKGLPRVVISWSDDRGSTWSDPRPVASPEAPDLQQFQPAVAVNQDGVLGVSWYDTQQAPSRFAFHQYFAASFDGGETFTSPHRVSGALSEPLGSGNLVPTPLTFSGTEGELRVALISAASRWVNGGDYMGLTTSADGHFHPIWADARSGTYQVYTAAVRILDGPPAPPATVGEPVEITGRIELVNDPGSYDAETGVADLWIRLRNVSATPVAGPIEVEIRKFGSGMGDMFSELAPEVLNADNGLRGNGAVFRYDEVLGSEGILPPGGVTGAVLWRLKLVEPVRIPNLHLYITGREVVAGVAVAFLSTGRGGHLARGVFRWVLRGPDWRFRWGGARTAASECVAHDIEGKAGRASEAQTHECQLPPSSVMATKGPWKNKGIASPGHGHQDSPRKECGDGDCQMDSKETTHGRRPVELTQQESFRASKLETGLEKHNGSKTQQECDRLKIAVFHILPA